MASNLLQNHDQEKLKADCNRIGVFLTAVDVCRSDILEQIQDEDYIARQLTAKRVFSEVELANILADQDPSRPISVRLIDALHTKESRDARLLLELLKNSKQFQLATKIEAFEKELARLMDTTEEQPPLQVNLPLHVQSGTPQTDIIATVDGMITFMPRKAWGAKARTQEPPLLKHPLPYVIITHTAAIGQFMTTQECVQAMQGTQNLNMGWGWSDISCNFFVGNDGIIYEGRGWTVEGATARGWNHRSIGIGFIGKYVEKLPTSDALDALKSFLQYMVTQGILKKDFTIHCLRQVREQFADAPGDPLYHRIQGWKSKKTDGWAWREKDDEEEERAGPSGVPLSQQYQETVNRELEHLAAKIVGPREIVESLGHKGILKRDQRRSLKDKLPAGDEGEVELNKRILSHIIKAGSVDLAFYLEALLESNQRLIANVIYKLLPEEEKKNIQVKYRRQKEPPQYKLIPYEDIDILAKNGGQYKLGAGSYGIVLLAKYKALEGRRVAVKQLRYSEDGELSDIERLKQCFESEAEIMCKLRHPDIVNIFGTISDARRDKYCIVMEYMEAGSLAYLLEKVEIPWPVKVRMLKDVSHGLLFLNTPQSDRNYTVIHRDIKAKNILINEYFQAKISDFGTSAQQIITSRSLTPLDKMRHGTLTHTAPELLGDDISKSEATEKSDIWSFGITIFEVCAENVKGKEWRTPFPETMSDHKISIQVGTNKENPLLANNKKQLLKIPPRGPGGSPNVLFNLMLYCCEMDPSIRPKGFKEVSTILDNGYSDFRAEYSKAMGQLYMLYEEKVLSVTSVIREEVCKDPEQVPMDLDVDDEYRDAISAIMEEQR